MLKSPPDQSGPCAAKNNLGGGNLEELFSEPQSIRPGGPFWEAIDDHVGDSHLANHVSGGEHPTTFPFIGVRQGQLLGREVRDC